MYKDDIVIASQLSDGREIVIKPFNDDMVTWRFKSDDEIRDNTFYPDGVYIWQMGKVFTTVHEGVTLIVAHILNDNIILNEYYD